MIMDTLSGKVGRGPVPPILREHLRGPVGGFRALLIALCGLLSLLPPRHPQALVVLLLLGLGAWAAYRRPELDRWWPYVGAVLSAAAVPFTGGARSPLLPGLLGPGLSMGLRGGPYDVVVMGGVLAAALLGAGLLDGRLEQPGLATSALQWVLLSMALGLVAVWVRRLSEAPDRESGIVQARELLRQLRNVTHRLPGSLDAPTAAAILLDRCAEVVPSIRSAVLVQPSQESLVPLAVRGSRRVPWRAPIEQAGPLGDAWRSGEPVVDVRTSDESGRRRGSALAVVPFRADGRTFGLVVMESFNLDAFPRPVLDALSGLAEQASIQLETALLFEEVRATVTLEERDRLARDMHDGVAQELAFVGYQLDDLRRRAGTVDPVLAEAVADVRTGMTRLISDIRLSITDLRTTVTSDRGLGSAVSHYLRAVCSGKDVALHLSMQESAFRLPAEQEVLFITVLQRFTGPIRRSAETHNVYVYLYVDPPSASLRIEYDGTGDPLDVAELEAVVALHGGHVAISPGVTGGPCLLLTLGGVADDGVSATGGRPRVDQAGVAERLRGDRRPRRRRGSGELL